MAESLQIIIEAIDNASGVINRVKSSLGDTSTAAGRLNKVGGALQNVGNAINGVGRGLTAGVTVPLVAAGGAAIAVAANFEKSMNGVRAVTGATGESFTQLRDQAKDLGSSTAFSASQAADAQSYLGMAGFETQQIIDAMPSTLALASAGNMDLARTADIASNVLTGYGMQAGEMARVSDVFAQASRSANTNVEQLGTAFGYVGPVAKSAGYSFEETTALLGKLSDAGYQGSKAGTVLRGGMARLLKPTGEAASTLARLGVETRDAAGNLRPMGSILDDLKTSGADTADMLSIFGQVAGPGMAALMAQGGEAIGDLQSKLENANGTAQEMADIQMQGLSGQLTQLRSAGEGLAIAIGDTGLLNVATGIVKGITGIVQALSQASPAAMRFAVVFAAIAAAVGPVLMAIGGIASGVGALISAFGAVSAAVGIVTGALGVGLLPLLGIVALGVAGMALQFGVAFALIRSQWSNLQAMFSSFASAFMGMVGPVIGPLVAAFQQLGAAFQQLGAALMSMLPQGQAAVGMFSQLGSLLGTVVGFAVRGLIMGITLLVQGFTLLVQGITMAVATIAPMAQMLMSGLMMAFTMIGAAIQQIVMRLMMLGAQIGAAFMSAVAAVRGAIAGIVAAFASIGAAIAGVVATIRSQFAQIPSVISGAIQAAIGVVQGAVGAFRAAGAAMMQALAAGIQSAVGQAVAAVSGAVSQIRGMLPFSPAKYGPLSDLDKTGPALLNTMAAGINPAPLMSALGGALAPIAQPGAIAPSPAGGSAPVASGGQPIQITINVNGGGGDVVENLRGAATEIAEMVEQAIARRDRTKYQRA